MSSLQLFKQDDVKKMAAAATASPTPVNSDKAITGPSSKVGTTTTTAAAVKASEIPVKGVKENSDGKSNMNMGRAAAATAAATAEQPSNVKLPVNSVKTKEDERPNQKNMVRNAEPILNSAQKNNNDQKSKTNTTNPAADDERKKKQEEKPAIVASSLNSEKSKTNTVNPRTAGNIVSSEKSTDDLRKKKQEQTPIVASSLNSAQDAKKNNNDEKSKTNSVNPTASSNNTSSEKSTDDLRKKKQEQTPIDVKKKNDEKPQKNMVGKTEPIAATSSVNSVKDLNIKNQETSNKMNSVNPAVNDVSKKKQEEMPNKNSSVNSVKDVKKKTDEASKTNTVNPATAGNIKSADQKAVNDLSKKKQDEMVGKAEPIVTIKDMNKKNDMKQEERPNKNLVVGAEPAAVTSSVNSVKDTKKTDNEISKGNVENNAAIRKITSPEQPPSDDIVRKKKQDEKPNKNMVGNAESIGTMPEKSVKDVKKKDDEIPKMNTINPGNIASSENLIDDVRKKKKDEKPNKDMSRNAEPIAKSQVNSVIDVKKKNDEIPIMNNIRSSEKPVDDARKKKQDEKPIMNMVGNAESIVKSQVNSVTDVKKKNDEIPKVNSVNPAASGNITSSEKPADDARKKNMVGNAEPTGTLPSTNKKIDEKSQINTTPSEKSIPNEKPNNNTASTSVTTQEKKTDKSDVKTVTVDTGATQLKSSIRDLVSKTKDEKASSITTASLGNSLQDAKKKIDEKSSNTNAAAAPATVTSPENSVKGVKKKKSIIPKLFGRNGKDSSDDDPQLSSDGDVCENEDKVTIRRKAFQETPATMKKSFSERHGDFGIEGLNLSNFERPKQTAAAVVQDFRIFVGTWNVGGRAPYQELNLEEFLQVEGSSDVYVLGFQEIVPLSAGNVLVIEDNEPAVRWLTLINQALNYKPSPSDQQNPASIDSGAAANSGANPSSKDSSKTHFFRKPSLKTLSKSLRTADSSLLKACNCYLDARNNEERPTSRRKARKLLQEQGAAAAASASLRGHDPSMEEFMSTAGITTTAGGGGPAASSPTGSGNYSLVASKQMVGIFLTIWARKELMQHIAHLRISCLGRGIMGCLGNKGCISISLSLHQTSLCFVCSHLASGEKEGDELKRNSDVAQILKSIQFPKICKHPTRTMAERIIDHDRTIWFGDLNYRVSLSYEETKLLLEDNNWDSLLEKDQLNVEKEAGRVFSGWKEGKICFAPTYKYTQNSDSYAGETAKSKKKRRTPAWCDRILWKGRGVEQLSYVRGESRFSDHRPVCAVFGVEIEILKKNSKFRKGYSCAASGGVVVDYYEDDDCVPKRHSFYDF